MNRNIKKMYIITFISLISPSLISSEASYVKSISGDVYLLSLSNRWERVYDQEKFNSGLRVRTEKGSSLNFVTNDFIQVILNENSMLELNENFSSKSNVVSYALFYGSAYFIVDSSEKKIRVITPDKIFIFSRGKFKISIDKELRSSILKEDGKIISENEYIKPLPPFTGEKSRIPIYANIIHTCIDDLKSSMAQYERDSNIFESLIEKISSKKVDSQVLKEIEKKLSDIFELILRMNESKNCINMHSMFLRAEFDERGLSNNEDDDIFDILEDLKRRQQEIYEVKIRYNKIISSELPLLIKNCDSIKNGRKKR